jgi:hypothetical protein
MQKGPLWWNGSAAQWSVSGVWISEVVEGKNHTSMPSIEQAKGRNAFLPLSKFHWDYTPLTYEGPASSATQM